MSRRKQSNPKPIKRQGDEDDDDTEMTEQLQRSEENDADDNQSDGSISSEAEDEPMESDSREVNSPEQTEREITANDETLAERKQEMMKSLRVPDDVLTLKKVEESEFVRTGVSWSLVAAVPTPKGSSIGPYTGELVALSSIKQGELVLPFQGQAGEFAFVKVTDEAGAWLSHLKPAENPSAHNTAVFFEGDRIWMETVSDLEVGSELTASFALHAGSPASSPVTSDKSSTDSKLEPDTADEETPRDLKPVKIPNNTKPDPRQLSPTHAALIYGCPFCGVRFSSPRTLEAHLTYYCSKKPPDFVSMQQLQQRLQQENQSVKSADAQSGADAATPRSDTQVTEKPEVKAETMSNGIKRLLEDKTHDSDSSSDIDAPKPKSPRTGQVFKCTTCEYTADKISSLNRHRRIHNRGADSASLSERLAVSPVCQSETFCKDCNIQFSSMSTYRGHKDFYCRHRLSRQDKSDDSVSEGSSPSGLHLSPTAAAMPQIQLTNPLLVAGKGHLIPDLGTLQSAMVASKSDSMDLSKSPLLLKAVTSDSVKDLLKSPPIARSVTEDVGKFSVVKSETGSESSPTSQPEDGPLDLSFSKPKESVGLNVSPREGVKHIRIKAEPRSPNTEARREEGRMSTTPHSMDPEESTGSALGPDAAVTKTTLHIPSRLPVLIPNEKLQYVKNKPIPPLQLVSRCVECNIVFYKYENFLIHKEHYCSGRRSKESPEVSTSPEPDSEKEQSEGPRSGRETDPLGRDEPQESRQKSPSPTSPSPSQHQHPATVPRPQPNEIRYRFYCIPCKIKFSSAGNLKAHKEFYCPHGKDNEQTLIVKEPLEKESESTSGSDSSSLTYRCENCQNEFLSARLLKLHFCTGLSRQTPLLRCPYCDYVTQTENRLSEHMKVHIPTKAFKCTICGYRGNTPRGMRMHGKMHIDNGEEFTDDNMREYEEPPLVPVQRNGVGDKGPIDVEAELIRMKNEPYKRRRSRKSFEKSENFAPYMGQGMLPNICAACGQAFTDVNNFVLHLRMHEMAALEAAKILKCEHCSYVAESLTSLLVHLQSKHPEHLPGTSKADRDSPSGSEGERSQSRNSQRSKDERSNSVESSRTNNSVASHEENGLKIKLEIEEGSGSVERCTSLRPSDTARSPKSRPAVSQRETHSPIDMSPPTRSESVKDLNTLEYQSQNHVQHISPKLPEYNHSPSHQEQMNGVSRQLPSPGKPVVSPRQPLQLHSPQVKVEPMSPPQHAAASPVQQAESPASKFHVKDEPMSPAGLERAPSKTTSSAPCTPTSSPRPPAALTPVVSPNLQNLPLLYGQHAMLSLYHLPPGVTGVSSSPQLLSLTSGAGGPASPASSDGPEISGRKYCRHCDINFTYLSSFLTHKKFYCSARTATEELSPSATA